MDVCRENTDVRWVGFHPLHFYYNHNIVQWRMDLYIDNKNGQSTCRWTATPRRFWRAEHGRCRTRRWPRSRGWTSARRRASPRSWATRARCPAEWGSRAGSATLPPAPGCSPPRCISPEVGAADDFLPRWRSRPFQTIGCSLLMSDTWGPSSSNSHSLKIRGKV